MRGIKGYIGISRNYGTSAWRFSDCIGSGNRMKLVVSAIILVISFSLFYAQAFGVNPEPAKVNAAGGNKGLFPEMKESIETSEAYVRFIGENAGDLFGNGASAGDFNGDGRKDIYIGTGPICEKAGYIFFNKGLTGSVDASRADIKFVWQDVECHFVLSGYWAGDFNGDGKDDFIVSCLPDTPDSFNVGKVFIFFGRVSTGIIDLSEADITLTGPGYFGYRASTAGDFNGDGKDDIIVGDSGHGGAAYIFFGRASKQVIDAAEADIKLEGQMSWDGFGLSVSTAGDFNGDGKDDVIVGAPYGLYPGRNGGNAYIFFGRASSGTMTAPEADVRLEGADMHLTLGKVASTAGDFNGDGKDDVIVGCETNNSSYIFFGSSSGDYRLSTEADVKFVDFASGTGSSAGDYNGDGKGDIIIGSPSPYIFFGRDSKEVIELTSDDADINLLIDNVYRCWGASAGDYNGDGLDDVIVSSPMASDERGEVFLFSLFGDSIDFLVPLSPDPNPYPSHVMAGGTFYRFYQTIDEDRNPEGNQTVQITCNDKTFNFTSNADGLLTIQLKADDIGVPGEKVTCSVKTEDGTYPLFSVEIAKRESFSNYKLGTGINVAAGVGIGAKLKDRRGLVYTVADPDIYTEKDETISVGRAHGGEVGVFVGGGVGGGIEGICHAKAKAEVSASMVFSADSRFTFPDPYSPDQAILRSGLILASLFQSAATADPLSSILIDYILESKNGLYSQFKGREEFSIGAKLAEEASVEGGLLNIGESEDASLGVGAKVKIAANAQLLGHLINQYAYASGALNLSGRGFGASMAAQLDLFGEIQVGGPDDKIGSLVKLGVGAGGAGAFKMILYTDASGAIDRADLSFSGQKNWGVKVDGSLGAGTGSTSRITLTVNRDQLIELASHIANLMGLKEYAASNVSRDVDMGPTQLKDDFIKLFDYLNNMTIQYKVLTEKGEAFSFSPKVSLAAGAKIEAGVDIKTERSVSLLGEEGKFVGFKGPFPLAQYAEDEYVPDVLDLKFTTVVEDCAGGVFEAAKAAAYVVQEVIETIGDTIVSIIQWVKGEEAMRMASSTLRARTALLEAIPAAPAQIRAASLTETQVGTFGIGGVYAFSPEGTSIAHLSGQISAAKTIRYGAASIVLQPGQGTAQLTVGYTDADVLGISENDLLLFRWDNTNKIWVPVAESSVDTVNNQVSGFITALGTFTLGIPLPQGTIDLTLTPGDVDINDLETITVATDVIRLSNGQAVPDGTLVTVASYRKYTTELENFGTITTPDEDPATGGIQVGTQGGQVTFHITPPATIGAGVVMAATVKGAAQGQTDFHVVENLDTDGNGLPDYWERAYFGSTGQAASGDSDGDGLTNLEEYQSGTDPTKNDTDGDGMPDGWEVQNRLNPLMDDANKDPDEDGYTNLEEYQAGTDPHVKVKAGALQFSAANYSVNENGVKVAITVTRTGGSEGEVGVSYATSNGTATAGSDYTAKSGTLSWENGDTGSKTFDIAIIDDSEVEGDQTVNLTLSIPTAGAALGTPSTAVLKIIDNDAPTLHAAGGIPDTGQTMCYDNAVEIPCPQPGEAFYGQDASYLINPPSYTKLDSNGNDLPDSATEWAMVRDSVTGLIWEVKTDDGSIHDRDNRYSWSNAQNDFIFSLNAERFGGWSDWRLPELKELSYLVDHQRNGLPIDTSFFPWTMSSPYWSSTPHASYVDFAYGMNFYDGRDYLDVMTISNCVRAVRGVKPGSSGSLVDNGDDTVTDAASGLMWQQLTGSEKTWAEALAYCRDLSLGGYTDWRLPNAKDLRSIVDYERHDPAIDINKFYDTVSSKYWSSTSHVSTGVAASVISFSYGRDGYWSSKSNSHYVRAVRGGQNCLSGHLFILVPGQGSIWAEGDIMPIKWDTAGLGGNVTISISREGGKAETFETIATGEPNDGTYDWTVMGPGSVNCMLRIEPTADPAKVTTQGLFSVQAAGEPGTLQFKSASYSVDESEGSIRIFVTRTGGSYGTATVNYATANGTAMAGSDYTAKSGQLTWANGDTADKYVDVPITDDSTPEDAEAFTVTLSGVTGASLGSSTQTTVTVNGPNDQPPGALQFKSASYSVEESAGSIRIYVSRTGGSFGTASVNYATADGTAMAGSDYTAKSGQLTWADGDAGDKYVDVPITDDSTPEDAEAFTVTLSGASGASLGSPTQTTVTINGPNDQERGTLQFSAATYSVNEGAGKATVIVTRTVGSDGAVGVSYATSNGTATAGSDYTATSGTLSWSDGDSASKTFEVAITNDAVVEGNETVNLTLSNPTGGAVLGSQKTAVLTIVDSPLKPTVTTTAATSIGETGAVLNGTVNPNGSAATYYFQYGTTTSYGSITATASAGAGTSAVTVNQSISGLNTNTTYHCRLVATNSAGAAYGGDVVFTTEQKLIAAPGGLPDTGQTTCYNNTVEIPCPEPGEVFSGQDASYLINPPSYTKLDSNGNDLPDSAAEWVMVRDNVTGLIWEVKTDDGSIHDRDDLYGWQEAQDMFIAQVNAEKFGGHSDWRMPTIKELTMLIHLGRYEPAIDTDYFPNTLSSGYWSSTTWAGNTNYAWHAFFNYGHDGPHSKSMCDCVRCVRGGQAKSFDNLVINGDDTVTDTASGLMWQQTTVCEANLAQALAYCEKLLLAGYQDWRLPNARELRSIVDDGRVGPSIETSKFPNTVSSEYWSSTTIAAYADNAWGVGFKYGDDYWLLKSENYCVRAVRGGQNRVSGHLIILAPGQGSVWNEGDIMPITWQTQGISGNVRVSISREGGKSGTFETLAASTENDGAYDWIVDGPGSVNCMLSIEPAADPEKATTQGFFSIDQPTKMGPDIRADGSDGPVVLSHGDPVSITIGLNPGEYAGFKADWWIAVHTPFAPPGNWYTYVHPTGWKAGVNLCAQTALFELAPIEVLNMVLPVGDYTFYFAVDPPDGKATAELLDSVAVEVLITSLNWQDFEVII